jgi:hypothetical protein
LNEIRERLDAVEELLVSEKDIGKTMDDIWEQVASQAREEVAPAFRGESSFSMGYYSERRVFDPVLLRTWILRERLGAASEGVGELVIRFDGPPGPEAGRFVEAEINGESVNIGRWKQDGDDWLLILCLPSEAESTDEKDKGPVATEKRIKELCNQNYEDRDNWQVCEDKLRAAKRDIERTNESLAAAEEREQKLMDAVMQLRNRWYGLEPNQRRAVSWISDEVRKLMEISTQLL